MDRLVSPYPVWNETPNQYNARGYIFANNSNFVTANTYNYTAQSIKGKTILGGAPWYFYFGLKKGNTAINKFATKFIGRTGLNDE